MYGYWALEKRMLIVCAWYSALSYIADYLCTLNMFCQHPTSLEMEIHMHIHTYTHRYRISIFVCFVSFHLSCWYASIGWVTNRQMEKQRGQIEACVSERASEWENECVTERKHIWIHLDLMLPKRKHAYACMCAISTNNLQS